MNKCVLEYILIFITLFDVLRQKNNVLKLLIVMSVHRSVKRVIVILFLFKVLTYYSLVDTILYYIV